jgi:hypothetical protein
MEFTLIPEEMQAPGVERRSCWKTGSLIFVFPFRREDPVIRSGKRLAGRAKLAGLVLDWNNQGLLPGPARASMFLKPGQEAVTVAPQRRGAGGKFRTAMFPTHFPWQFWSMKGASAWRSYPVRCRITTARPSSRSSFGRAWQA